MGATGRECFKGGQVSRSPRRSGHGVALFKGKFGKFQTETGRNAGNEPRLR
jgi:hypothetical protein